MWMSSQYLDDQMSGYDFYGNTIINASTGVLLGGGAEARLLLRRFSHEYFSEDRSFDKTGSGQTQEQTWENDKTGRRNRIHSNVFLDNNLDIAFDNRGMNWMVSLTITMLQWWKRNGRRNAFSILVLWNTDHLPRHAWDKDREYVIQLKSNGCVFRWL